MMYRNPPPYLPGKLNTELNASHHDDDDDGCKFLIEF